MPRSQEERIGHIIAAAYRAHKRGRYSASEWVEIAYVQCMGDRLIPRYLSKRDFREQYVDNFGAAWKWIVFGRNARRR